MANLKRQRAFVPNSYKLLILISMGLTVIVNLLALITAFSGFTGNSVTLLLMVIISIIFFFVSLASNFRFSYTKSIPIVYVIFQAILLIICITTFAKTMNTIHLVLVIVFNVLSFVAIIVSMIDGANQGKKSRLFTIVLTSIFAVMSFCYGVFIIKDGFYGQGSFGYTTAVYTLNAKTKTYEVTGVKGRGKKLKILKEFRGKPVTNVDSAIFNASNNVEKYYFEDVTNLKFTPVSRYIVMKENAKFYAPKEDVFTLQKLFIDNAKSNNLITYTNYFNNVYPSDLDNDERYVSFTHTVDAIKAFDYQFIPMWIGKSGDTFNLKTHLESFNDDYNSIMEYLNTGEDSLEEMYLTGKRVITTPRNNGVSIENTIINKNINNVPVGLETVYKVNVSSFNDDKFSGNSDIQLGNRYVVKSGAKDFINSYKERVGFTYKWKSGSEYLTADTLETFMDTVTGANFSLGLEFALNNPTIESITLDKPFYVYGDNALLTSSVKAPVEGYNLEYKWSYDSSVVGNSNNHTITNALPSQSGEYLLTVTASSPETSLTSTASKKVALNVLKKTLNFTWEDKELVYDGTQKSFAISYLNSDVINSDIITYNVNNVTSESFKDAGTYKFTIELSGDSLNKYVIPTEQVSKFYEILKRKVTLVWEDNDYVYDGTLNFNKVSNVNNAVSSEKDELISSITYTNVTKNAGTHYVVATLNNPNYEIEGSNSNVTIIAKKNVSVIWGGTTLTYNGYEQKPTATIQGLITGDTDTGVGLKVSGAQTNAGNHTATCEISSENYLLLNSTTNYTIAPKDVSLSWINTTLTYNGYAQAPTPTANGLVGTDRVGSLGVTINSHKDVGNYTEIVTIANANYNLFSGSSVQFEIVKKEITVNWSNLSLTYNGEKQTPEYTISGLVSSDTASDLGLTISDGNINVGNYTATCEISNGNYELTNASVNYEIKPKEVTVKFSDNNEVEYTGSGVGFEIISISEPTLEVSYSYFSGEQLLTELPSEVGVYTVKVQISDSNYVLVGETQASFTIVNSEVVL